MRRRVAVIGAGLMLVAILVAGNEAFGWFAPEPALVEDLAGAGSSAQNESFRARLRHAFPVGSSERVLADTLRDQGFVQRDWIGADGDRHSATWHRSGFPCVTYATVEWTADARGKLVRVDGLYGYACL